MHMLQFARSDQAQILGFVPDGQPILPQSTDPKAVHREKLGWDEISKRSAKIVSFIGMPSDPSHLSTLPTHPCRSRRTRALSQDHIIRPDLRGAFLRRTHGRRQRRPHRHVERASRHRDSAQCARRCLHYQGLHTLTYSLSLNPDNEFTDRHDPRQCPARNHQTSVQNSNIAWLSKNTGLCRVNRDSSGARLDICKKSIMSYIPIIERRWKRAGLCECLPV